MAENLENRIAVVGMGLRFPGADSPAEFWRNLKAGAESLTFFSEEELRRSGVAEEWLGDPNYVRASTILRDVESFDAKFFDVPAAEARLMDPQHRLLLECAWEALESAGHSSSEGSQPVAVFAGVRINEYLLFHLPLIDTAGMTALPQLEGFQRLVASDKDFAATRISHKLKLGGPSMTVQTACSTSLVAVHMACQSLLNGECEIALAGGASVRVPQRAGYLHGEGMICSVDGHTRFFDATATGTVFGSGAGMVALRRLDDAVRDGDPIQAVILGSAVNNDAGSAKSFTAPSREGQLRVLTEAYAVAGVSPATAGYIEAHGTATALGDSIELGALLDLFRRHPSQTDACAIGSVKTNVGHLVQAAGVAGLIKAVLMLKHGELVPSLHFHQPNPNVELSGSPLYVNVENRPWPVNGTPRRAGVSGFGLGGTNAHIVLEEFKASRSVPTADAPYSVLVLSARDPKALRELAVQYGGRFNEDPAPAVTPVCHTAAAGRVHFEHRLAVTGPDSRTLEQRLQAFVRDGTAPGIASGRTRPGGERPRVAFLFTGLGSQYRGMGCDLYRTHTFFRSRIDECAELLRPYLAEPLTAILESQELLERAEYAQPALFALQHALSRLWISWGIEPDVVLGHSFGEYAAAHVAGVFSLEDGLRLAARRGKIVKELSQAGQMAVVFAGAERIAPMLESVGGVCVAACNGPSACSISGDAEAVQQARERCAAAGIRTAPIAGNLPFHSVLMDPCLNALGREIEQSRMSAPGPRFISSLTGALAQAGELQTADYWMRQTREPVRFADAMTALRREQCDVLIEIGPAAQLLALGRQCWPESSALWLPTLRANRGAWRQISESLAELYARGANLGWKAFYQGRGAACTRVELPTYPFQRTRYWIDVGQTIGSCRLSPEARQTTKTDGLSHGSGHPLLGMLIESPLPQKQFQARIHAGTAAYIQDHRILGQILLPGTAYIETARAAWAEGFAGGDPVVIENLSMQRALVLDESRSQILHTVLEPQNGGRAAVKIFSGESGRWLLHAECHVRNGAAVRPAPVSLNQIRGRCATVVPVEPFYASKLRRGSAGGTCYQSIRQLWRGQGESLSRVELARAPGEDWPALHPAALTSCIQAGNEDASEGIYLPYLWERIHIFGPLPENIWSHIREISNGPDLRTVDATIFDDAGNVLVVIEGLHFRRATKEALLRHAQSSEVDEDLLYELQWHSAPLPEPEPRTRGRWTVVGPENLKKQLSRMLDVDGPLRGVIHIAALDDDGGDPVAFEHRLCESALGLVKEVLGKGAFPPAPKVIFATRGTQCTGLETGPVTVAGSTLWGFGKTVLREHPGLGCRMLDLDPAVAAADALDTLALELNAEDSEPLTAWRDGQRLVPRLERYGRVASVLPPAQVLRIHAGATYLITGGLGGLGRSIAKWLADQGARSLALIGRRPPDAQGAAFIEGLRARGVSVLAAPVDVAEYGRLESFLAQVDKGLPPLRGVVHAAGVLNDSTLLEMDPARLASVLKPKVDGTWNLHRLTESRALDFFVLFSSASGLWGAAGQANYAAANAFLDSVAHYRRQRGLPATSIDWSAWAEVGMAAVMEDQLERYRKANGLGKIPPRAGVRIFGWALNQPRAQFAAAKIDWQLFGRSFAGGGLASFFSALTSAPPPEPRTANHPAPRIADHVVDHILECMASVLGVDRAALQADRPLQDYGLDSLMALQLRNRVMAPFADVHIPWVHFLGTESISALAGIVAAALEGGKELSSEAAAGAGMREGAI